MKTDAASNAVCYLFTQSILYSQENLNHYGNTLLVSVASEVDENGNVSSDFMLEGEAEKIGSALAVQMQKHPEFLNFIEYSLSLYDNLISHDQNVNDNG